MVSFGGTTSSQPSPPPQMVEGLRLLRVKDRYADEDEYLRTYLPLLWAETGASLQGAGQGSDHRPRLHSVV